ncbi:MAG TPA: hypothetical protein PLV92_22255, partial [Pirellulaceae bacterium]|nr:hypothetical protein [Pirellulaceae bacterium]
MIRLSGAGPIDLLPATSSSHYSIVADPIGSRVEIGDGADWVRIGGKVRAAAGIAVAQGTSNDHVDLEIQVTGGLYSTGSSISLDSRDELVVAGEVVATGANSEVTVHADHWLSVAGAVSADKRVTITAGSVLADENSIETAPGSSIRTTGSTGEIVISGYNDVLINSAIGPDSTHLTLLSIGSLHGDVVLGEQGRLGPADLIEFTGAVIDVQRDIESAGTLRLHATELIKIHDATVVVTNTDARIELVSDGDILLGGAAIADANHPSIPAGQRYQQGALIQAPAGVAITAADALVINAAVQVASSGVGSRIDLTAPDMTVVGSLLAGASVDRLTGAVTWTGSASDVVFRATNLLTFGGTGVDSATGGDALRGGSAQATGTIDIGVHGGAAPISFAMNELSLMVADATGGGAFASPTAPSRVAIDVDGGLQLAGTVSTVDSGSDIDLTAGGLVTISGILDAEDDLTILAGDDASGWSLLASGLLNTGAGGTISITAPAGVQLG